MKNGKFHKVNMLITHAPGISSYRIAANYKGTSVVTYTNDSTTYDNFDSDKKNDKNEALKHAYYKICAEYEYQKNKK